MSQLNITSIKNKRGDFGPTMVGLTTVSGDLNVTGTISGDGSGITGLANTSNVRTDTLTVTGVATATTFDGDVTGNADTATTSTYATTAGIATVAENLTGNPSISVTDITATGNVSIAGTLTYEDVTNVDSIGIITARSGVHFGLAGVGGSVSGTGNATFAGIVTATTFSGALSGNATGLSGTPNIDCGTGSFTGDVDIADKIIHTGDTNTAIRFPSTDTVALETAGSERFRIGSSGQIGLGGTNYGTSGQVITSNGSGSAPTWQDAAGAWNLISTVNASGATTVDITSNIDSTYRTYVIIGSEVQSSVDGLLRLRFYDNGTLNTSAEYDYNHMRVGSVAPARTGSEDADSIDISGGVSGGVGRGVNMIQITIDNPSASKTQYKIKYDLVTDQGADTTRISGAGAMQKGTAYTNVDGVRLFNTPGTLDGTFKLYGIS